MVKSFAFRSKGCRKSMLNNWPVPCSIIISITRDRGTCFSIVTVPQKGMNEGLETFMKTKKQNYLYTKLVSFSNK